MLTLTQTLTPVQTHVIDSSASPEGVIPTYIEPIWLVDVFAHFFYAQVGDCWYFDSEPGLLFTIHFLE